MSRRRPVAWPPYTRGVMGCRVTICLETGGGTPIAAVRRGGPALAGHPLRRTGLIARIEEASTSSAVASARDHRDRAPVGLRSSIRARGGRRRSAEHVRDGLTWVSESTCEPVTHVRRSDGRSDPLPLHSTARPADAPILASEPAAGHIAARGDHGLAAGSEAVTQAAPAVGRQSARWEGRQR